MSSMHGPMSNKKYVQMIAPFMRAESRVNRIDIGGRRTWFLYDHRTGKLWAGPCKTAAEGWKELALVIKKNKGCLINHESPAAIQVIRLNLAPLR